MNEMKDSCTLFFHFFIFYSKSGVMCNSHSLFLDIYNGNFLHNLMWTATIYFLGGCTIK